MSDTHRLGDLQLDILRCLWKRGRASASQVHKDLQPDRKLAPTTVATMLRRMETKGVVTHELNGRRFVYRALVSEDEVRRGMVSELTSRLFRGDTAALVSHLLSEGEIDRKELDRLKRLVEQREREERDDG